MKSSKLLNFAEIFKSKSQSSPLSPPSPASQPPDPFGDWLKEVTPTWNWDWRHLVFIRKQLARVTAGLCKRMMLFVPPQHGKLISHDTPVLTPSGWTFHGDLLPGNYVFGRDGKPIKVLAISVDGVADHEVAFTDGAVIRCHGAHEWVVNDRGRGKFPECVLETQQMAAMGEWLGQSGKRGGRGRFQVNGPAKRRRSITTIRQRNPVPGRCIQVEGGVYLVGETLIPTHNSEQATVRYPVYRLEQNPSLRVAIGCYNQRHANRFSRRARRIAERRGLAIHTDRKAVDEWELDGGGSMLAVGVGAGITGNPVDLLIIDDPVKNREEAESEAYREKVWDWYTDDLYTRLQPGAAMVLIQTRWHSDDLAGRILASEDAKNWEVTNLPAEAYADDALGRKTGEPLCPERFNAEELAARRRIMAPSSYEALYQQNPTPREGGYFKQKWFKHYTMSGDRYLVLDGKLVDREACLMFGTADLAASQKTSADYTVIAIWADDRHGNLILVHLVRDRFEGPDIVPQLEKAQRDWRLAYIGVETVGYQLVTVQEARRKGLNIREITRSAKLDKVARAQAAIVRVESGKVWFPKEATWLGEFEKELLQFDKGHDDQVDCLSDAANQMAKLYQQGTCAPQGSPGPCNEISQRWPTSDMPNGRW